MHHVGVHAMAIIDTAVRTGSLHALNELGLVANEAGSRLRTRFPQKVSGKGLNHAPIPVVGGLGSERTRRSRCSLFFDYFLKIFLAVSRCRPPGIPLPPPRSSGAALGHGAWSARRLLRLHLPVTMDVFIKGKGIWLEPVSGCPPLQTFSRGQRDKNAEAAQLGHVATNRSFLTSNKPRDAT